MNVSLNENEKVTLDLHENESFESAAQKFCKDYNLNENAESVI